LTILEIIQRGSGFLERKGVDSPRLQVELFLAAVLKMPRMNLYLNFERVPTAAEIDTVRSMIQRRAKREPLQYILGTTSFCGFEIAVDRNVLIPRPETELLAERAWKQLLSKEETPPVTALDFGTGSGCLAIALAAKAPEAQIHALDFSNTALELAEKNATANHVKVEFHSGDGFAALATGTKFNLIVSNPPYIPTAEIATLQPEVRDFEPRMALDGGEDGLDFYRRLAVEAKAFLKPAGRIMLEFGDGQGEALRALFSEQNWVVEFVEPDYTGRLRNLIARCNAE